MPRPKPAAPMSGIPFENLSDKAKKTACNANREISVEGEWWECVYEDFVSIAAMMGLDINKRKEGKNSNRPLISPDIYFSWFYSQGAGASFSGVWNPVKSPIDSLSDLLEHAPLDADLHEIALDLMLISERCNALAPSTNIRLFHGIYTSCHSMRIDVEVPVPDDIDHHIPLQMMIWEALLKDSGIEPETLEQSASDIFRRLADWLNEQLRDDYEYLTSDKHLAEVLSDDQYSFTEDGHYA